MIDRGETRANVGIAPTLRPGDVARKIDAVSLPATRADPADRAPAANVIRLLASGLSVVGAGAALLIGAGRSSAVLVVVSCLAVCWAIAGIVVTIRHRCPAASIVAATVTAPVSVDSLAARGLLSPAELEGVLAHELAHVRRRDVLVQTFAVMIAVILVELSRLGGFLERALLFVLGPVAAAFVHLLLSDRRELAADRDAAALCGTPHGLADALLRLDRASELVSFQASPATEPLYTVDPFAPEGLSRMFSTHPPVARRVALLRGLDPGNETGP